MAEKAPEIRKLDEVVVNRIAAGEVVQRPCNAIKELVENSIDARSDSISVVVDEGGLKLLQITDTGHGIRKEDMNIVCERFTTSKLKTFSDLKAMTTHGFRGEALASISHVSHVNIVTKTDEDKCAWKAHYKDGKLHSAKPGQSSDPKPCAGNTGTTITAEDLFYNMGTRKRAMNGRDEFAKVAHVITCYAVHNTGVAFSLKKHRDNMPNIRTLGAASKIDTISNLFGPTLGKELIDFTCEDKTFGFKSSGYLSNANFSGKTFRLLLFINNRLVESSATKKAFEAIYASVLPKNSHPFVYLSIEIDPQNIDVNVHPTKNEVHFLHEDSIIAGIQAKAEQTLYKCATSRTYYTQARLPGVADLPNMSSVSSKEAAVYDHQLVRTDCDQLKLDRFVNKENTAHPARSNIELPTLREVNFSKTVDSGFESLTGNTIEVIEVKDTGDRVKSGPKATHKRPVYLSAIIQLQEAVCKARHEGAVSLLRESQFVGVANLTYALIQCKTKLYLFDFKKLSKMLFYQIIVFDFQNFDVFRFTEPAPLKELVMMALSDSASGWKEENGTKEELAVFAVTLIMSKREMLDDYYSVTIDAEENLTGLPILLTKYHPMLHNIPMFLLRLATEVDWDTEEGCFTSLSEELAELYSMKPLPGCDNILRTQSGEEPQSDPNVVDWKFTVEHVLFPQFKSMLIPSERSVTDGTVLQVADLHDLYKVFERC